jgi:DNA-binding transcriptional MerR regulator
MSKTHRHPLTVIHAAERLGVSRTRVIQLDPVLQPRRSETGVRLYRADAIDRVARTRAARRGGSK